MVLELRDISFEQAKKEAKSLFSLSSKPFSCSDVADELRIDFKLATQVCDALVDDGVFEECTDVLNPNGLE